MVFSVDRLSARRVADDIPAATALAALPQLVLAPASNDTMDFSPLMRW
jgi:phosphopantothenoylcysteine synthetase/decarboxylase